MTTTHISNERKQYPSNLYLESITNNVEFARTASVEAVVVMARELLAARATIAAMSEQPPVAYLYSASFERGHVEGELEDAPGCDMAVYAAPQPAVVQSIRPDITAGRFLPECLKGDEISGDARHARISELMGWFSRYYDGNANPKWLREHAAELCYYILTAPQPAVVPDEITPSQAQQISPFKYYVMNEDELNVAADFWNACRTAMLKHVNNRDESAKEKK